MLNATNATKNPKVKEILLLLGISSFIAVSLVFPALPMTAKPIVDIYNKRKKLKEDRYWGRFNKPRLRYLIKRLQSQKIIEIYEENGESIIKLTEKGKKKVLQYKLEELMLNKPPKWDGKWRLIIYDIKKEKRVLSEIFRKFLQKMEFVKLQRSVYLTPYRCDEQIEFLRQYYNLGQEVLYLVVNKIENEEAYKDYFGI